MPAPRRRAGLAQLEQLAEEWAQLASVVTALANAHEQAYRDHRNRDLKPSYDNDYDRWLREAAYIKTMVEEQIQREAEFCSGYGSWNQIGKSLKLAKQTAYTRYRTRAIERYKERITAEQRRKPLRSYRPEREEPEPDVGQPPSPAPSDQPTP